jgi:prepilin-type N-terminal cleavage/methylation domain-containing protein
MKSRIVLRNKKKGFTLIEMLVALAVLAVVIKLGLILSLDFYKGTSYRSEKDVIISVLQKARSQSMNNIDQVRHGVHFTTDPLQYRVFQCDEGISPQCDNYGDADTDQDIVIDPVYAVAIDFGPANTPPPFDVIFEQLSGSCVDSGTFDCSTDSPITIIEGTNSSEVNLNTRGRIDW